MWERVVLHKIWAGCPCERVHLYSTLLYESLFWRQLEYASSIWHPYKKNNTHIIAIENVQRRATRYLPELKGLDYPDRLAKLNLPTLTYRRTGGTWLRHIKYFTMYLILNVLTYLGIVAVWLVCPAQEAIPIKYSWSNADYLNENIASRIEL